jgi:ABC-2 type transport system permease protein
MSLWRLEWLRLVRTHRLLAILGVYVFFGLTGPLTARYMEQILGRLGTNGIRVEFPPPTPADGIDQFAANASQIGLLVVVLVAGSALAFDARREMAVFVRTRVAHVRDIVVPAYMVTTAGAVAGLVAGALAAWYETAVLLGPVPAGRMLLGIGLGALFLAFAVALVAFAASLVRSSVAAAGLTLGGLLAMGVLGGLGAGLGRWLPTHLLSALTGLVRGAAPSDFVPATVVTVIAAVAALAAASWFTARREL